MPGLLTSQLNTLARLPPSGENTPVKAATFGRSLETISEMTHLPFRIMSIPSLRRLTTITSLWCDLSTLSGDLSQPFSINCTQIEHRLSTQSYDPDERRSFAVDSLKPS